MAQTKLPLLVKLEIKNGALLNALLAETCVVFEILIRKQIKHQLEANDTFNVLTFETPNQI